MRISLIILMILLAGCSVQRKIDRTHRFIAKHPEILEKYITFKDSLVIKDTTIYRDTTLKIFIPGDTIYKTMSISCPDRVFTDSLIITSRFSKAISYVADGRLHMKIEQPNVVLKQDYDSLVAYNYRLEQLYTQEILRIETKQPILWYYKAALWGFIGMIFLLIVLIVILKLLKKIPKL